MKKTVLLTIALIMAGFFAAPAQNNFILQERLQRQNPNFEYSKFEAPKIPTIKTTVSGQDWWYHKKR